MLNLFTIILVGTKSDLRQDQEMVQKLASKGISMIDMEKAQLRAKEIGAKEYLECSSLTQEGLKQVFDCAIREALKSKTAHLAKKQGCCVVL